MPSFICGHTAHLGVRFINIRSADAHLSAQLRNWQPRFHALKRFHDLTVCKSGLLHLEILSENFLLLTPLVLREDYRTN